MVSATGIKKILIFDDDADFRSLLLTILGKSFQGIKFEEYDPVGQGIPDENFDWSQYDVLLLDYYLCIQGMTGLDILQANRKNLYFPATIMLTGAGNEEVAVRALKAGVYDYMRKEKLDKQKLRIAILDAYEKHKVDREKFNELTNQSQAFNKAMFYQKLELKHDDPDYVKRVLLLIELDKHKTIVEQAGLILRDNIVRHLAKQSFEVFRLGECNPSITRLSDVSVALLIDDPGSGKTLDFNINGLCNHLRKHPYKFEGNKFRFTVSIGVVSLAGDGKKAHELIQLAKSACLIAGKEEGNTFHVYQVKEAAPARHARDIPPTESKPEENQKPVAAGPKDVPQPRSDTTKPGLTGKPAPERKPIPKAGPDTSIADKKNIQPPAAAPAPVSTGKTAPKPAVGNGTAPQKQVDRKSPEPSPAAKPAPASGETASDEIELIESELNEEGHKLKKAFEEKRVMQTFQPLISLTEITNDNELQYVSLEMIDTGGAMMNISGIQAGTITPVFQKYIDRWLLRETIGRLINRDHSKYTFIIPISAASLADATLFNWLRRLLSGLDARNPGSHVALEITARDFMTVQKQATALMAYLSKSHGFKFILSEISDSDDIKTLFSKAKFDLFKMKHEVVVNLMKTPADATPESKSILNLLKSKGALIIVDNVEDATTLTNAITLGVDFAMGFFIGEPTVQLEDTTNIESFEIV